MLFTAVYLLDKQQNLCGMVRSLVAGDNVGYLSDETIAQDILPLEKFAGESDQEKAQARAIFLLTYLANRAINKINFENFIIIAAKGREPIYETIGFDKFPMRECGYELVMKLAPPCALLNEIKSQLIAAPSNVAVLRRSGSFHAVETLSTTSNSEAPKHKH